MRKFVSNLISVSLLLASALSVGVLNLYASTHTVATLSIAATTEAALASNKHDTGATPVDTLPETVVRAKSVVASVKTAAPEFRMNRSTMRITGITDMGSALYRLPGVSLRDYGSAGAEKTLSARGLGAPHTGVTYDGMALSDTRAGQIDLSRYSLNGLSEIVFNLTDNTDIFIPVRNAMSGASLNLISLSPRSVQDGTPHLNATLRAGSFALINPYLNAGVGNSRNLKGAVSAEYLHANNNYPFTLHNGSDTQRLHRTNAGVNNYRLDASLLWLPSSHSYLSFKLYGYDNAQRLPGLVRYYNPVSHERLYNRIVFGQGVYTHIFNDRLKLRGGVKFNFTRTLYTDTDAKYLDGELRQLYLQREAYATVSLLYSPITPLSINYSADYIYNNMNDYRTDNLSSADATATIIPSRSTVLQSVAVKYDANRFTAMARGIFSMFFNSARYGDAGKNVRRFSPTFALSWQLLNEEKVYLRAAYKEMFRLPSFSELYFDHFGSINLRPENTRQINLGVTAGKSISIFDHLEITADGYLNFVTNKIVAIPYNLFISTMTNLGKVRIMGLDITLSSGIRLDSRNSLEINGTYSYQRAQPRTSPDRADWMKQVSYTPLNSGSASVLWSNPWVNTGINMTAMSARYTTNTNVASSRISGFATFGLWLYHDFLLRNRTGKKHAISVRGDLRNIFDRQYSIVARYPMPGRAWEVSVSYSL